MVVNRKKLEKIRDLLDKCPYREEHWTEDDYNRVNRAFHELETLLKKA